MRLILVLSALIISQTSLAAPLLRHEIAKAQYTVLAARAEPEVLYELTDEEWKAGSAERQRDTDKNSRSVRIYKVEVVSNEITRCERLYMWLGYEYSKWQVNKFDYVETYRCFDVE